MIYEFFIPGQPVGKARPRIYNGHGVTPEKTVMYENLVKVIAQEAIRGRGFLNGKISLRLMLGYKIPTSTPKNRLQGLLDGKVRPTTKPDWDNVGKIVSDALNGIAYQDDSQIVEAHVFKHYSPEPGVLVTLWETED